MDYNEALDYIGSRMRFGIKPGLERTRRLLSLLGDPQDKLKFVHVAGTNGKGSTCTYIASALRNAGYRTGLFTSPYICDFRERMQINGEMIERDELARLTESVSRLLDDIDPMTEFEIITCIAMKWFAERGCDIVVLEVGLGGRLDSTNVIEKPLCCAITRIDYDHTAILGDTIEAIAGEKAGILKPGCPVVISPDQLTAARAVIADRARLLSCDLYCPDLCDAQVGSVAITGTDIEYKGLKLHIPLIGEHQISNAITAIEVLRVLSVSDADIAAGIAAARIPARLERISDDPIVLIDGAHNPNGAAALRDAITTLMPDIPVAAVMGVLRDKDYSRELGMLAPLFSAIFTCDGFSERCLSSDELSQAAGIYSPAHACPSPEEAFDRALKWAGDHGGAVLMCGSLYLAGRLREYAIERCGSPKE